MFEHPPYSDKVLVSEHETQGGSKLGENKARIFVTIKTTTTDDKPLFPLQKVRTFSKGTTLVDMLVGSHVSPQPTNL